MSVDLLITYEGHWGGTKVEVIDAADADRFLAHPLPSDAVAVPMTDYLQGQLNRVRSAYDQAAKYEERLIASHAALVAQPAPAPGDIINFPERGYWFVVERVEDELVHVDSLGLGFDPVPVSELRLLGSAINGYSSFDDWQPCNEWDCR